MAAISDGVRGGDRKKKKCSANEIFIIKENFILYQYVVWGSGRLKARAWTCDLVGKRLR